MSDAPSGSSASKMLVTIHIRAFRGERAMAFETITKDLSTLTVTPNLVDYDAVRTPDFWERARASSTDCPAGGGLNIAHEAVDRHAGGAAGRAIGAALARQGRGGARPHLRRAARVRPTRFANVLDGARRRQGRPRRRARRAHPGALRRGARHAQEPQRLLPALLGVRAGADPDAARDRRRAGAA